MKPRMSKLMVLVHAERKKLGVLGILVLALGLASLRALVLSGPRSANAAPGARSEESPDGNVPGAGRRTAGHRPDIRTTIPAELTRDLFALDESQFPRPSQTEPPDSVDPKSAPAKVETSSRVEPRQEEDPPEVRIAEELRKLRLKGTILGGSPMAVIELAGQKDKRGTVVRPGESIEGFTLIEVVNGGVVLEKDGVRVELKRALPEG
jgi:hypothetical protein